MRRVKHFIFLAALVVLGVVNDTAYSSAESGGVIDLGGRWRYELDPEDKGVGEKWYQKRLGGNINLPGTLDGAGIGHKLNKEAMDYGDVDSHPADLPHSAAAKRANEMGYLVRERVYIGKAWYQREIEVPVKWEGKHIGLRQWSVLREVSLNHPCLERRLSKS